MTADPAGLDKARLRRAAAASLRSMKPAERAEKSAAVRTHLIDLLRSLGARRVMGYLALRSEVDLDPLLGLTGGTAAPAGVDWSVPSVDWSGGVMRPVGLAGLDGKAIITGSRGVREAPADAVVVDADALDVVLVPGLAFDGQGGRLGRGGGFYDRFLAKLPESVVFLGLLFDVQRVERVPMEPHDRPVHMLIGESGVTRCAASGGGV